MLISEFPFRISAMEKIKIDSISMVPTRGRPHWANVKIRIVPNLIKYIWMKSSYLNTMTVAVRSVTVASSRQFIVTDTENRLPSTEHPFKFHQCPFDELAIDEIICDFSNQLQNSRNKSWREYILIQCFRSHFQNWNSKLIWKSPNWEIWRI